MLERIQERCFRTVRAPVPSVTSSALGQSTHSSRHRQPISSLSQSSTMPFNTTPPAPSSGTGSALLPNQRRGLRTVREDVTPAVDPNFPLVAEMMRSQEAANAASIQSAISQATYLRTQTEWTHLLMLDRASDMVRKNREQQYRLSLEVLQIPNAPDSVHERAGNFIIQYLNDTLPAFDFPLLTQQLGMGLPGIANIADVFANAPALAPNNAWSIAHTQDSSDTHTPTQAPAPTEANLESELGFDSDDHPLS
jgi:hypothetical protein